MPSCTAQMSPVPKSPAGLGLYPERRTDDLPATTLSLPSVRRDLSQVHPQVTLSMTVLKPSLAFWDLHHHLQGLPRPPSQPPCRPGTQELKFSFLLKDG